jgi:hypothetical protein
MTRPNDHDPGGYERTDAHFGATFRAGLYILGTMFLTAALLVPIYRLFVRTEAVSQPRPRTVIATEGQAPAPAGPRLLVSEPAALAAHRAQEDAILHGYAWVEKDKGIARIPIEEAMRIVAERGLPTFQAPATPTPPPAGGAR